MDKEYYEFKNDKYEIIGYPLDFEEKYKFKVDYTLGEEDYNSWVFNINGKTLLVNLTGNIYLNYYCAVVKDNYFHLITDFDYYKFNLDSFKLEENINLDEYSPFTEIYEFYNGFVLIAEMDIIYIENSKVIWHYSTGNIIESVLVCKDNTLEVVENYPYKKYFINKNGKII